MLDIKKFGPRNLTKEMRKERKNDNIQKLHVATSHFIVWNSALFFCR